MDEKQMCETCGKNEAHAGLLDCLACSMQVVPRELLGRPQPPWAR